MSKTIQCTIEKWQGTVTLKTSVNYADMIVWDDSLNDAAQWLGEPLKDNPDYLQIKDVNRYRMARLPGILHFIEAHTLAGLPAQLTVDNFPALPRVDAANLFTWLRNEINKIIAGESDDEKKGSE